MTDWKPVLKEACERARSAVSRSDSPRERSRVVGMGAAGDKTLVADRDAEREIISVLKATGSVKIVSEEAGTLGDLGARCTAVVDPLDGSSNFSRGLPFYCTSIGIAEGKTLRSVRYAMVMNLVTGDAYYAEKGAGASKNGRRIRTSQRREISRSVVGADMSRGSPTTLRGLVPLVSAVGRQVHFGANALELCLLAEGGVEAFVDVRGRMRITDFAAGYLVASEAGAVFSEPEGDELDPALDLDVRFGFVASANQGIHREIVRQLRLGKP